MVVGLEDLELWFDQIGIVYYRIPTSLYKTVKEKQRYSIYK